MNSDWENRLLKTTALVAMLSVILGCAKKSPPPPFSQVEITSYKELGDFYRTYGFTYEAWHTGFRAVPRAYISDVPRKWAQIADSVTLDLKKRIFYSALLPLVLKANEKIVQDRKRMEPIAMQVFANQNISEENRQFLKDLADRYKVKTDSEKSDAVWVQELLNRVDTIPPAIAMAQAAYESAFATSRFAGLGNALFGEYASEGKRMETEEPRARKGAYQIAAFDSPLDCVDAYAFNLNTNAAYADFRRMRASFRRNGKLDDVKLASTLIHYSIRGVAYTREIARIIENHHLTRADLAFLRDDMDPITVVPKAKKNESPS